MVRIRVVHMVSDQKDRMTPKDSELLRQSKT